MIIRTFILVALLINDVSAEKISSVVEKTLERMESGSYSYSAVVTMNRMSMRFKRRVTDKSNLITVHAMNVLGEPEMMRLLVKGNFWYLKEHKQKLYTKYRPWEAFPQMPNFYYLMMNTELTFNNEKDFEVDPAKDEMVYFSPVDDHTRKITTAYLEQMKPFRASNPQVDLQAKEMEEVLAKGRKVIVDQKTGILTDYRTPKLHMKIQDFEWLPKKHIKEIKVGELQEDLTQKSDLNKTVYIRYAPLWRSNLGVNIEGASAMFNLETKKFKRVPFQGAACGPGSVGPQKVTLYVSGMNSTGSMGIYAIDLETGQNFELVQPLGGVNYLFPKISPDGSKLVYFKVSPEGGILTNQIMLMDFDGNASVKEIVSIPTTGSLNWRHDSQGLFVQKGVDTAVICSIDLKGNVTEIIPKGERVIVIGDNELLFKKEKKYWTSDYQGKNIKPSPVDFSEYFALNSNFISHQLIMMKKDSKNGPRPCLWEKGDKQPKVITDLPGLWSFPVR